MGTLIELSRSWQREPRDPGLALAGLAASLGTPPGSPSEPRAPRRGPLIGRGEAVTQVRGVLAERVVVSTELDPYLPLKALAAYSGLSKRTLEHFIALPPDDALPCYRLPGKVLVRRSDFDTFMEQFRSRGRPSLVRAIRELGLAQPGEAA